MEPLRREDGWLLQTYGEDGEMRAHWETDEGGGRWVEFVAWWRFEGGRREPRRGEKASETALAKLVELLVVRGARP